MTKSQAKQFAKIYIGQLFYDHTFDKDLVDCPDETTYTGRKHRCVATDVVHLGGKRGWYVFSFK